MNRKILITLKYNIVIKDRGKLEVIYLINTFHIVETRHVQRFF